MAWNFCDQDKVLNNIVDKTFGARQSTLQRGKALVLKIVEGSEPTAVTVFLLSKLNDKRPKVAPICIDLITEGIILFGARPFPMKEILKSVGSVFNSSNGSARESAMSLFVELHKWIGLPPLQPLLETLRPAQRSDFDKLVSSQIGTSPVPTLGLKKDRNGGKIITHSEPVVEARDLVEEIDLSKKLKGSEFHELVSSDKWADQARALDLLLNFIGSTPKLKYNSAISEILTCLNQLLKVGHIQVQLKSLKLICLIADGCRAKVSSEMRAIFLCVLNRSREKKLYLEVEETLTTLYLYCISFDPTAEEFLEYLVSKKNPPNCKMCLSQVLINIMEKSLALSSESCRLVVQSFTVNADDSDAKVREITIRGLQKLRQYAESSKLKNSIIQFIESIQSSNPKLHKKIAGGMTEPDSRSVTELETTKTDSKLKIESSSKGIPKAVTTKAVVSSEINHPARNSKPQPESIGSKRTTASIVADKADVDTNYEINCSVDEAVQILTQQEQLQFSVTSTKLQSSKWQDKVEGFSLLEPSANVIRTVIEPFFVYIAQIGIWKSSNVNVLKAAIDLFIVVFQVDEALPSRPVAALLIETLLEKISDKKLQKSIEALFDALLSKGESKLFLKRICCIIPNAKSPAVHQSILSWLKKGLEVLKVNQIPVQNICQLCLKEMENKTAGVRTAAIEVVCYLYSRIGTPLTSCIFTKDTPIQIKSSLEQELAKIEVTHAIEEKDGTDGVLEIPRKDISEYLEKNLFNELNCIEGKDSWQIRKAALDKILDACNKSGHFLEFNKTASETIKHLKQRLSDTQSNLKPLATQVLAHFISSFPADKAAKCVKAIGSSILSGLSENKKAMRDSTVAALEIIVSLNGQKIDGNIFMMVVLTSAEILSGSIGRLELLTWINSHRDYLNGDCGELMHSLVSALQDKTSQVRLESEILLSHLISHRLVSRSILDKAVRDLSPAVKRSIQAALDRILLVKDVSSEVSLTSEPLPDTQIARKEMDKNTTKDPAEGEHLISPIVLQSSIKISRVEDWGKWPSIPSVPSLYDLAILKNKWKAHYNQTNNFPIDGQDLHPLLDYISSLSNQEIVEQSDYIFRLISFHLGNTKDDTRLDFILQIMHEFLVKAVTSNGGILPDEIHLCLPHLYCRLSYLTRSIQIVNKLHEFLVQLFSLTSVTELALSCIPLIDASSRITMFNILEELFSLFSLPPLPLKYSKYFSRLATGTQSERERCKRFLEFILGTSPDLQTKAFVNSVNSILGTVAPSAPAVSKASFQTKPISVSDLIEEFVVLSNLSERVSIARCKQLADETRIVLESMPKLDDITLQRRLPDYLDSCGCLIKNIPLFDLSVIHSALALLYHLFKQPICLDLTSQNLKNFLLSMIEFIDNYATRGKQEYSTLWRSINLIIVKAVRAVKACSALATLVELMLTTRCQHGLQSKLILIVMENESENQVTDEELLKLFVKLNDLLSSPFENGVNVRICKSIIHWLHSIVGSERIDGIISSEVTALDYLKVVVSVDTLKTLNTKGGQVVDIIHEITFSKDKAAAIGKLYEFKQANPEIDLNGYLSKLSIPFRNFVQQVFSKFEETENTENKSEVKNGNQSSEAMKIIENLKARPPGFRVNEVAVKPPVLEER